MSKPVPTYFYKQFQSQNKYGAKKTECLHGHTHDSKKEAERCNELHLLQRAGEIHSLEVQKAFLLIEKQKYSKPMKSEQKAEYKADFYYFDNQMQRWVIEDSKGHRTKDYVLKRKLVKHLYCSDNDTVFIET